jgi:hypothetical protein
MSLSLNGQNTTQNTIQAMLNRLQELEDAAWFLLSSMALANAFGDLLDKYGAIVGEPRLARSDADFKAGIRLRIRVNISSGRAADIIAVAQLSQPIGKITYIEGLLAGFIVEMLNLQSAPYIVQKMQKTRAAGTHGLVQYTEDAGPSLVLDSVSGGVTGAGTIDTVTGGVVGAGKMSVGIAI